MYGLLDYEWLDYVSPTTCCISVDIAGWFEKLLKNMGKWDEVTQLDYNTLNKIIIEESWEKHLLDTVKEYMKLEQAKRLYPSKIKKWYVW